VNYAWGAYFGRLFYDHDNSSLIVREIKSRLVGVSAGGETQAFAEVLRRANLNNARLALAKLVQNDGNRRTGWHRMWWRRNNPCLI
jgi:hypothetical protein